MLWNCWHNFLFFFQRIKPFLFSTSRAARRTFLLEDQKVKGPWWAGLAQLLSVGLGMDRNTYRLALESNVFKGYGVLHFLLFFFFSFFSCHCLCLFLSSLLSYIDDFGHNFFTSLLIKRNRHVAHGHGYSLPLVPISGLCHAL